MAWRVCHFPRTLLLCRSPTSFTIKLDNKTNNQPIQIVCFFTSGWLEFERSTTKHLTPLFNDLRRSVTLHWSEKPWDKWPSRFIELHTTARVLNIEENNDNYGRKRERRGKTMSTDRMNAYLLFRCPGFDVRPPVRWCRSTP